MTETMTQPVEMIRRFASGLIVGVGKERDWFVYMCHAGKGEPWQKHCGPYPTRADAVSWIEDVREDERNA